MLRRNRLGGPAWSWSPLVEALTEVDRVLDDKAGSAEAAVALAAFVAAVDSAAHDPSAPSPDVVVPLLDRIERDPDLVWLSSTDWRLDRWVSDVPFDPRRVAPLVDGAGPFGAGSWKPDGGLWTAPAQLDQSSVWDLYQLARNCERRRGWVTDLRATSGGGTARILMMARLDDVIALGRRYPAADGHIAWSRIAEEFDAIRFSWRTVIEGAVRFLSRSSGCPQYSGLSVPCTLWFRPERYVTDARRVSTRL